MKTKWLRIGSLVFLLGLIAAIPASTQVLFGSSGGDAEGSNLPLIILVNRMELTPEQMEEIHGLLEGLLEEREALELRRAELEEDMIAFTGTAEALDEILEAFRAGSVEQVEAARKHVAEVIDRIKEILTLKQGEVLAEVLPGLLGDRGWSVPQSGIAGTTRGRGTGRVGEFRMPFGRQDEDSKLGLREQLLERLEERFGDRPEIVERLQQRLGESTVSGPLSGMAAQGGGFGMSPGGHEQMMGRSFGGCGRPGLGFQQRPGGVNVQIHVQPGEMQHQAANWIEQLVEVLELKLEAIG